MAQGRRDPGPSTQDAVSFSSNNSSSAHDITALHRPPFTVIFKVELWGLVTHSGEENKDPIVGEILLRGLVTLKSY